MVRLRAAQTALVTNGNAVVSVGSTEGVGAAAVGVATDAGAAPVPFSPFAAADPVLILLNRHPLEKKLFIAVSWFSLVSNCLTYFFRPSQVLYVFIFTIGRLTLHVAPHSRRSRHPHPDSLSTRRPSALESGLEGDRNDIGGAGKRHDGRVAAAAAGPHPPPAAVVVPPPSARLPFTSIPTTVLECRQHQGDDSHSCGSCGTGREIADVSLAGEDWVTAQRLSSPPTPTSRRLRRRLCWYAHRRGAHAEAYLV